MPEAIHSITEDSLINMDINAFVGRIIDYLESAPCSPDFQPDMDIVRTTLAEVFRKTILLLFGPKGNYRQVAKCMGPDPNEWNYDLVTAEASGANPSAHNIVFRATCRGYVRHFRMQLWPSKRIRKGVVIHKGQEGDIKTEDFDNVFSVSARLMPKVSDTLNKLNASFPVEFLNGSSKRGKGGVGSGLN